jgi:heme-degrading monooxygenase HmoA
MILRIFRVMPQPGKGGEFAAFFRDTAMPLMKAQPGLVSLHAAAPRLGSDGSYCMVMVWRDEEAIRDFVGEDWEEAHVHPDEAGIVAHSTVAHFDLIESWTAAD